MTAVQGRTPMIPHKGAQALRRQLAAVGSAPTPTAPLIPCGKFIVGMGQFITFYEWINSEQILYLSETLVY